MGHSHCTSNASKLHSGSLSGIEAQVGGESSKALYLAMIERQDCLEAGDAYYL